MDIFSTLEGLGRMFYIHSPNQTSFETVEEVPNYNLKSLPYFILLVAAEQMYMIMSKKRTARINDMIISTYQGILQQTFEILLSGWRLFLYSYIYYNWRILTLPWNSCWTWWTCFIIVDFLYYWAHRASHEINLLWAAHQVHHSSEDYNLCVALRQSFTLNSLQWVFYLPMALAIPPSVYLVHNYFNLLYQFWIHTDIIQTIGPFEYILNTASHHRVHHGRNKYCIDKNYAGVLIIWDRMFGTFEAEKETVVYGLTHNVNSFDSFYIQLCHFVHIWKTFREMKGWKNKIFVLIKGPGWSPGKPRLGDPDDIPEVEYPVKKFDPHVSTWRKVYLLLHVVIIVCIFALLTAYHKELPASIVYAFSAFLLFSSTAYGRILENRNSAPEIELLRCMFYFVLDNYCLPQAAFHPIPPFLFAIARIAFTVSAFIWITYFLSKVKITWHPSPKKIH